MALKLELVVAMPELKRMKQKQQTLNWNFVEQSMTMNQLKKEDIYTLFIPPPDLGKGHS